MILDDVIKANYIEALILFLDNFKDKNLTKKQIYNFFQPISLSTNQSSITSTLKIAKELDLINDNNEVLINTEKINKNNIKNKILENIDRIIFKEDSKEKWFALFFSFALGENKDLKSAKTYAKNYARDFNQKLSIYENRVSNPFNDEKCIRYLDWYNYIGLSSNHNDLYYINPYNRIKRNLNKVFGKDLNLKMDNFILKLGEICLELDGGRIFKKVNTDWKLEDRKLSKGLTRALYQLHINNIVKLKAKSDARDFWQFNEIKFPFGKYNLETDKIYEISLET